MGRNTRRDDMLKAVGRAVKKVREADPDRTQKKLAERVAELDETCPFRNQPTIADLELGNYNVQLEDIGTLATALGCSWTDLVEPAFAADLGEAVVDSDRRATELRVRVLNRQQHQVEAFLGWVDNQLQRPEVESLLEDLAVLPTEEMTTLARLIHARREEILPTVIQGGPFLSDAEADLLKKFIPADSGALIPAESATPAKKLEAQSGPTKRRRNG